MLSQMQLIFIVTTRVAENPMFHKVWDMVQRGAVKLQYVPTEEQVVDVQEKNNEPQYRDIGRIFMGRSQYGW